MSKTTSNIVRKLAAALLALVLVVGLLPTGSLAAEANPTDWNFLTLFVPLDADYEEDGVKKHVKTSLSSEECKTLIYQLVEFESVMKESGVMTTHFKNLQLSTPLTKLTVRSVGPYPTAEDLAPYLKAEAINLDEYDHVFIFARMDGVNIRYGGVTPREVFDNGTTFSFIPADSSLGDWGNTPKRPAYILVHEFLHTMEERSDFDLHKIEADCVPSYLSDEVYKACMLDIILNRITGEHGSGVRPEAWKETPTVRRNTLKVTIPNGTTEIRNCAYLKYPNLTSVTIPNSVTSIGQSAFSQCSALTKITIPNSVTSIGKYAFKLCSALTEITLPDSVQTMDGSVFDSCTGLRQVTLPSHITTLPPWTFGGCTGLTQISIPTGVTSIGEGAFYGCTNLNRVDIPASVTSIADWVFNLSGVKDIYFSGTEAQWEAISIGGYNYSLNGASMHYQDPGPASVDVEGIYRYVVEDGQLRIISKSNEVTIFVAWYDDDGRFMKTEILTDMNLHEFPLPEDQTVKIMAVNANFSPLCTATPINP